MRNDALTRKQTRVLAAAAAAEAADEAPSVVTIARGYRCDPTSSR